MGLIRLFCFLVRRTKSLWFCKISHRPKRSLGSVVFALETTVYFQSKGCRQWRISDYWSFTQLMLIQLGQATKRNLRFFPVLYHSISDYGKLSLTWESISWFISTCDNCSYACFTQPRKTLFQAESVLHNWAVNNKKTYVFNWQMKKLNSKRF